MTIFTMFFIELMAARFDIFGSKAHDIEASDPSLDLIRQNEKSRDAPLAIRKGLSIILVFEPGANSAQNRKTITITMGMLMVLSRHHRQERILFSLQARVLVLGRAHPETSPTEQFLGEQTNSRTHQAARITLVISVTT
jgi:hypothetical protein